MRNLSIGKNSALLITDRQTRKYLTGVDIAEGFLVVEKAMTTLTDARYFSAAKITLNSVGVNAVLYQGENSLKKFLSTLKIKTLLVDFNKTTVAEYKTYSAFGYEIKDCAAMLERSLSIKTNDELDKIKRACAIAEKAYHKAIKTVTVGISELELKERIENLYFELGADGVAFETIVAFGANGAVPHHETGETKLTVNTPILIDMGCTVGGFCSDLTRTAFFGRPTEKFVNCYNAVKVANQLAIENIYSNMRAKDADAIARNYLKEKGLDKYFTHSLGHGLGLRVHEYPTLSKKRNYKLADKMVFTIEPGVYFDGEFGIRIEDTVVLDSGKVERLYTDDKELLIL